MICVAIHLIARPGQEDAVESLFAEYIPLAEKLPGVVGFQLNRSRSNPQRFLLYELYETYEALEQHRSDTEFAVWRPRIAALEESRQLEQFDTLLPRTMPSPKASGGGKIVVASGNIAPVPFPIPGATEGG